MTWQLGPAPRLCEKCGKPLVIRWGKQGGILACTGYPECAYTCELAAGAAEIETGESGGQEVCCQNCGRPMILRKGRFGTFYACTGYPECKATKQIA